MKFGIQFFIGVIFIFSGAACTAKTESYLTQQKSETEFFNDYFDMTLAKPADWYALGPEELKGLMDAGSALVAGENKKLKTFLDASKQRTISVATFFKHAPGAPVDFNPSVAVVGENVSLAPGVKTGEDYFFHARKIFAQSSIEYNIDDEYARYNIGGEEFTRMGTSRDVLGQTFYQDYYVARYKEFIVAFILTYNSEDSRNEVMSILEQVQLDWD